jgi:hypothetical protein
MNSIYKGKQPTLSVEQLARSGIKPPGSGYFASRSNVSLVDPTRILQSASSSSLNLAHPRPVRKLPSASNLMRSNQATRIGYHYRSTSANSFYSSRPSSRASSFNDLPAHVAAAASLTVPAPSAWKAIHPPSHHLHHSSSLPSLRTASSSTGSLAMIHQYGPYGSRPGTAGSNSSSRGSPQTASWTHYKTHKRTTSSQSSSSSSSSRLEAVEEEAPGPTGRPVNASARTVQSQRQPSPDASARSPKGKAARYRELPATPSPHRNRTGHSDNTSLATWEPAGQDRGGAATPSQLAQGQAPGRYRKVRPSR